jgi:[ribosomal protein S5]-alanine N-acetyltransferase
MFDYSKFPTLETERLRLREIVPMDTADIFAIRGDYEVTRYNIGAAYEDATEARELIQSMAQRYLEGKEIRWGITLNSLHGGGDTVIGMCGFNYWHQVDRRASIGFDIARAYWRRGIMREAVYEILRFGFTEMDLNRVEADASAENEASIRLLTRLGFMQEGRQRQQYYDEGAFHDLMLFGLLREDWDAMNPISTAIAG